MHLDLVNIGDSSHTVITVERLQGYRFELMPTGGQARSMRRFAGSCRYVYNRALAQQLAARKITGKKEGGYASLCKQLTEWRNDPATEWLYDAPIDGNSCLFGGLGFC